MFKLDPSTGALLASFRYSDTSLGNSSVVYESGTDKLFVSYWRDPGTGFNTPPTAPAGAGIFRLNPATLAVETRLDPSTWDGTPAYDYPHCGPQFMICRSGVLYGVEYHKGLGGGQLMADLFSYNVGTATGNLPNANYDGSAGWYGIEINATELWVAGNNGSNDKIIGIVDPTTMLSTGTIDLSGELVGQVWGLCVNPSNGRAYLATRTGALKRVNQDHTILADIALGGTNPTPFCCRYNSVDSLIYVPTYKGNSVVVVNPATDTVVATKTGFDSPFDVVFTPTKKFAIQHSSVGLKEIV